MGVALNFEKGVLSFFEVQRDPHPDPPHKGEGVEKCNGLVEGLNFGPSSKPLGSSTVAGKTYSD